jgi:hypothetical protein
VPKCRNFLFILTLFYALTALAGSDDEELFQALHRYQHLNRLKVDFNEKKILKSIGTILDSTGRLSVTRNPKVIIWEILKPSPVRVKLSNDEMQITTAPGSKTEETQILHAKDANARDGMESQAALSSWLNLDAKALGEEYTVTEQNKLSYVFTPKKKSPFVKIQMKLSKAGYVDTLILEEASGDTMELKFGTPKLTVEK